jgi:para-nitrobenzyl esterase
MRLLSILLLALVACSAHEDRPSGPPTSSPNENDAGSSDPTIAQTEKGPLRGAIEDGARIFRGVAYAKAPVGPRRWHAPEEVDAWGPEARDALSPSEPCVQIAASSTTPVGSEDCLTLNVWAPLSAKSAPVLVWIHGGDNVEGSARDYDGKAIALQSGAVVVTINYRLGAFGFLAHPALSTGSSTGNYGLLDQIAALEWVQKNIRAFGGDPTRVAAAGQSAGASDICALLVSPRAKGLFSRAILQSLYCYVVDPTVVASTARSAEKALGCTGTADVAACLRAASAEQVAGLAGASLANSDAATDYYVTVDGAIVPEDPEAALRAGRFAHMPIILGTTSEEYLNLLPLYGPIPTTEEELAAASRRIFGDAVAQKAGAFYPLASYGDSPGLTLAAMLSDVAMNCPTRRAARAFASNQPDPVYRYVYAHAFADPAVRQNGAAHGFDAMTLFRNFSLLKPTPADFAMAETLTSLWTSYAADGVPSAIQGVTWPRYETSTEPFLILDGDLATSAKFRDTECNFWDAEEM